MLLNCACALPREPKREPKGAEGSRTPVPSKPGQPQNWVSAGTSIFPAEGCKQEKASWQQARSAPKLAKKKQLQLVLPGARDLHFSC